MTCPNLNDLLIDEYRAGILVGVQRPIHNWGAKQALNFLGWNLAVAGALWLARIEGYAEGHSDGQDTVLGPGLAHLSKACTCLTCGGPCWSSDDGECYRCYDMRLAGEDDE